MRAIHNSRVGAGQDSFIRELFQVLFAMRGRVNFTNVARYSCFVEQAFRRNFRKAFGWVAFNLVVLQLRCHSEEQLIGALRLLAEEWPQNLGTRPVFLLNGWEEQAGA